ncbi:MAG: hypothetical protein WKG00_00285 [Polyangiaceae bacterium]
MPASALGLVVVAAVLHASWNVLTKRAADPLAFLWSSMSVAALGLLPFAVVIAIEHGLPRAGCPSWQPAPSSTRSTSWPSPPPTGTANSPASTRWPVAWAWR